MSNVKNNRLIQYLKDFLRLNEAVETIPKKVSPLISPTFQVNDPLYFGQKTFCKSINSTSNGSVTIFTSDSNYDTYITALELSATGNATANNTFYEIRTTINGVSTILLGIPKQTTTAHSGLSISLSLPTPLKIDRNVTVTVVDDNAAGAIRKIACVYGFTETSATLP